MEHLQRHNKKNKTKNPNNFSYSMRIVYPHIFDYVKEIVLVL